MNAVHELMPSGIRSRGFRRLCLCGLVLILGLASGCGSEDQSRSIRLPSQKPAAESSQVSIGDLYAVVVGVANYNHPKIPRLKFADKDAKDFGAFLESQKRLFRKVQVRALLNQQATRVEIEKCLVDLRLAGENDTIIVYLSGHGTDDPRSPGQFFFLPYDADADYLAPSSVNMSRQEYLQKLPSKRVLLVADTCHSGGFPTQTTKGIEPAFERFVRQIKDTKGRIVLSASRADEVSLEKPELSNGVFTYYLLEGLRGAADANHDGVVTLHELYSYVHEKTKDITGGIQHPRIIGDMDGSFPMSLVSLQPSTAQAVKPSKPSAVRQPQTELDRLRVQAESGDPKAQFELGVKYEYGFGVSKETAEALKWYYKASEQGNRDAQGAIARLNPTSAPPSTTSPFKPRPAPAPARISPPSPVSVPPLEYMKKEFKDQIDQKKEEFEQFKQQLMDSKKKELQEFSEKLKSAAPQERQDMMQLLERKKAELRKQTKQELEQKRGELKAEVKQLGEQKKKEFLERMKK